MKSLVFGDIHGNATALKAVLEKECDFDSVVFLGDALSPGPQPNETAELLSGLTGLFIQGNHEKVMLNPNLTANWPDGFKALMDWIYKEVDHASYELLASFNQPGEYELQHKRFVLAHGDENPTTRHVLPKAPASDFAPLAHGNSQSPVLFGHSHVQFQCHIGSQNFINPGSVGQNRCGTVAACYGLLVDGNYTAHHVRYDPTPWQDAVDRIPALQEHSEFGAWFKQQTLTGFANGAVEPWLSYGKLGYL